MHKPETLHHCLPVGCKKIPQGQKHEKSILNDIVILTVAFFIQILKYKLETNRTKYMKQE